MEDREMESMVTETNRIEPSSETLINGDGQKMEEMQSEKMFKTPCFVIPSRKLSKTCTEAEDSFKSPSPVSKSTSNKNSENDQKTVADSKSDTLLINSTDVSVTKATEKSTTDIKSSTKTENKESNRGKISKLSPAEQLKQSQSAVPYKEPQWSGMADKPYNFEVIKNGAIIDKVDLTTNCYHVFGRLPSCDVSMEHPSLSRYHAVVQFSRGVSEEFPKGWYLYDLDSTHGTWINKNKIPPLKYHRLHVDYVVKFGGSTRLYILQGPSDDREEESDLSVSEMKDQREKQKREAELLRQAELAEEERLAELQKKREEDRGCTWGFEDNDPEDDEEEEGENEVNPFSTSTENEELYISDPKKSLNGYFEREGYDLPEYVFDDVGHGKRKCSIELPIDTPTGEPMVAEVVVSGKKKEAVVACALEACRILDRHGLLRKSNQESKKKKAKNWEEDDYYDSDDDTFLDRTGIVEKKRLMRMSKAGKGSQKTETYDTLLEKHKGILLEITEIEAKLEKAKVEAAEREDAEMDALDAYMSAIKSGAMDTKTKMKLKRQLLELKQEEQKVRKLINIAQPAGLPEIKTQGPGKSSLLSGVGKMKGFEHNKVTKKPIVGTKLPQSITTEKMVVEEEDDSDDEKKDKDDTSNGRKTERRAHQNSSDAKPISVSVKHGSIKKDDVKPVSKESEIGAVDVNRDSMSHSITDQNESTDKVQTKGPTLPLAAVLERLQNEAEYLQEENSGKKSDMPVEMQSQKSKRKGQNKDDSKSKKVRSSDETSYDRSDPDYAVWLPPQNQSGDGKTHLNSKYGY